MKMIVLIPIAWCAALTLEAQIPVKPLPTPPTNPASSTPVVNNSMSSSDVAHLTSFVAGTSVFTKKGLKTIDEVEAGDRVWATDSQSFKSGYHTMSRASIQSTDALVELLTQSRERIDATPGSLFWVNTKGWVQAKSLFPGDQLLQRDGTFTRVFNVIPKRAPDTKVYSIEVEDLHTYYVGQKGILVHNVMPKPTTN